MSNFLKFILLSLLFAVRILSQTITVKDSLTGKPLSNVLIQSKNTSVFTDEKGNFQLTIFMPGDTLEISHIAYKKRIIPYQIAAGKKFILLSRGTIKTSMIKIIGKKSLREQTELATGIKITNATIANYSKVGDLLRKKTLLFIRDYGGLQTVSSRGMSAENTLVLFNEAKVNDLRTGAFDFSSLPASVIEEAKYIKNYTQNST